MKNIDNIKSKIEKKEKELISKNNQATLLNVYNKILYEYFRVKEPITKVNKQQKKI